MQNVNILNVIMLYVVLLPVIWAVTIKFNMLSVIILNVTMMIVVKLTVIYSECHNQVK